MLVGERKILSKDLLMKMIFLILLFSSSLPALAKSFGFQYEVNFSNLFLSGHKVDYRSYGLSENMARSFTVINVFHFPKESYVEAQKTFQGNREYQEINEFSHPSLGMELGLMDNISKKIIAYRFIPFNISVKTIERNFAGSYNVSLKLDRKLPFHGSEVFKLENGVFLHIPYSSLITLLEGIKFSIFPKSRTMDNWYIIRANLIGINRNQSKFIDGPILDLGKEELGDYLQVGSSDSNRASTFITPYRPD